MDQLHPMPQQRPGVTFEAICAPSTSAPYDTHLTSAINRPGTLPLDVIFGRWFIVLFTLLFLSAERRAQFKAIWLWISSVIIFVYGKQIVRRNKSNMGIYGRLYARVDADGFRFGSLRFINWKRLIYFSFLVVDLRNLQYLII